MALINAIVMVCNPWDTPHYRTIKPEEPFPKIKYMINSLPHLHPRWHPPAGENQVFLEVIGVYLIQTQGPISIIDGSYLHLGHALCCVPVSSKSSPCLLRMWEMMTLAK